MERRITCSNNGIEGLQMGRLAQFAKTGIGEPFRAKYMVLKKIRENLEQILNNK